MLYKYNANDMHNDKFILTAKEDKNNHNDYNSNKNNEYIWG